MEHHGIIPPRGEGAGIFIQQTLMDNFSLRAVGVWVAFLTYHDGKIVDSMPREGHQAKRQLALQARGLPTLAKILGSSLSPVSSEDRG